MEYAFAILMFAFGAGLLIYALFLAGGNYDNILRNWATNPPDKEKYTKEFGKMIALLAIPPIFGGALSFLINTAVAGVITGVLFALFFVLGINHMKKYL